MSRHIIAPSHWGHDAQVREAVSALGPRQRPKFDRAFPEWSKVEEVFARNPGGTSGFYPEPDDGLDPEYLSWVADWIEANTRFYWEDGELWAP